MQIPFTRNQTYKHQLYDEGVVWCHLETRNGEIQICSHFFKGLGQYGIHLMMRFFIRLDFIKEIPGNVSFDAQINIESELDFTLESLFCELVVSSETVVFKFDSV